MSILVISSGLFLSQLALSYYDNHARSLIDLLRGFEILAALLSVSFILCMPLRAPDLPTDEISPTFEKPGYRLRSPEDNLTLWQFMSVSWMSPLISVGSKRQLNSEDVWKLGFEFQHRLLHQKFRELSGSVVRRLLAANGFDLLILLVLGTVEAISSTRVTRSLTIYRPTDMMVLRTRGADNTPAAASGDGGRISSTKQSRHVCNPILVCPFGCLPILCVQPVVFAAKLRTITGRNDHDAIRENAV